MERVELLIERLAAQYRGNAGPDKLLLTAQLLLAELQKEQRNEEQTFGQKISVFYPAASHFSANVLHEQVEEEVAVEQQDPAPVVKTPEKEIPINRQELFDPVL